MQTKKATISCCVIGDDNLSAACIEYLLARGDQIVGICTSAPILIEWANKHNIRVLNTLEDLTNIAAIKSFDYLFSIANKQILPESILALPKKLAINFHNAPLPKYSGAHPTAWAILNHETQFGITWHVMSTVIDGGELLKQKVVLINEKDTTATLNIKCYDAAIETFRDLIADLSNQNIKKIPQNLSQRSYFKAVAKPFGNGIISWNKSASDIYDLFRALDFGKNDNSFALPKIMLDNTCFIVTNLEITTIDSSLAPGSIVACSKQHIQVSTKTKDILIKNLISMEGKRNSIHHIIKLFNLKPNDILASLTDNELFNIQQYAESIYQDEKFWFDILLEQKNNILNKLIVPMAEIADFDKKFKYFASEIIDLDDQELATNINYNVSTEEKSQTLLTILLIYFYRINNYENYTTGIDYCSSHTENIYQHLYAMHVPLTTNFEPNNTFYEALYKVKNIIHELRTKKTFSRDIYLRYPELNNGAISKHLSISIVDDFNKILLTNDSVVSLVIHRNKYQCRLLFQDNKNTPVFLRNAPAHIKTIGLNIFQNPKNEIKSFSILPQQEYRKLVMRCGATKTHNHENKSIIELFEQQVKENSSQPAVHFYEQALDYLSLNKKANQLAHHLVHLGVNPRDFVAISIERSMEMIIAVLATLKVGATYIPIDANCPTNGIQYIINDCKPRVFLTTKKTHANIMKCNLNYVGFNKIINLIDSELSKIKLYPEILPSVAVASDDIAYIMYTSGTTGEAKGVEITHKSLINLVYTMRAVLNVNTDTRILLFSSFSFDGSVWEIFNALSSGATLCLAEDKDLLPIDPLIKTLLNYKITLAVLPAAVLNLLSYVELPDLKILFSVGEHCSQKIIQNWANKVTLINGYGPTEATVCTTMAYCKRSSSPKCIGKPIYNVKAYVLDLFANLMPIGIPGEINIGGLGLAKGYLNKAELTEQRFTLDPFVLNMQEKNKIYKTGDLGYWLTDGNLYCLGRTDKQVKVRGFRIELGSIENILKQHPLVNNCVVTVKNESNNSKLLIAYVAICTNKQSPDSYLFREYLKEHLPEYMVPQSFIFLEKLPLNKSGKVDLKVLPIPDEITRLSLTLYVEPRTDLEKHLENIWSQVLHLNKVGVYDDFFHIGGHSLLIAQLLLKVNKELNTNISLHNFLEKPTIESMAKFILGNNNAPVIEGNYTSSSQLMSSQLMDLTYGLEVINRIDNAYKPPNKLKPNAIFLTGCSGFVGKYILCELCKHSAIPTKIYCLMREQTIWQAKKRLEKILRDPLFNNFNADLLRNIVPVLGDLSKPFLGLQQTDFNSLATKIDIIYHVGAYVNHLYNYEQLRDINVIGTLELIKFAAHYKIKKMNYISALSAITEKDDNDIVIEDCVRNVSSILEITDGYSQTKWISEVLFGYTKILEIPIDIFRLGWVLWDQTTNLVAIKNNHLYSLVDTCIQLGYAPNWKAKLNLMPVRFIGEFVARSGLEHTTGQRIFNLVNPNTVEWTEMINSFADETTPINFITPKQWHKKCLLYFGTGNTSFPFLPLYLDVEKSVRLKAPDLGTKIKHKAADDQVAKLGMQYPIVFPFHDKLIIDLFKLPAYSRKPDCTCKEKVQNYLAEYC